MAKNRTHWLFIVSVVVKGTAGLLDLVSSALLFLTGEFTKLVIFLTQQELGEDPTDFIANRVKDFLPYFSVSTELFAAWYFLIHGVVNVVLVYNLLRKRLWAFPAAIYILFLFIFYQLYRFAHTHSYTLIVLSVLDVFVIWFILREYRFIKLQNDQTTQATIVESANKIGKKDGV